MKNIFIPLIVSLVLSIACNAQTYTGPIPKPLSGYGSDGSFLVDTSHFLNPDYPSQASIIIYPQGVSSPVPTMFFCHGGGANQALYYQGLFKFIAQKGYAVVFVPYSNSIGINDRYELMKTGFSYAADNFSFIDTTQVGFIGHSFGGGMSIAIGYHFMNTRNWGSNGRFLMPIAQFYSFQLTQADLLNYPSDVKLLSIIYDDDNVNDHRMAIDIFNNINIPDTEKDIVYIKSSTVGSYAYLADHNAIATHNYFDALDYYAVYRLLDAMMDYVFNGNILAKDICLGDGNAIQTSMPSGMEQLIVTDTLTSWRHPETYFGNACSSPSNPRAAYCNSIATSLEQTEILNQYDLFPNPSTDYWHILASNGIESISVYNLSGANVESIENIEGINFKIDISDYPKGIYVVAVNDSKGNLLVLKGLKL